MSYDSISHYLFGHPPKHNGKALQCTTEKHDSVRGGGKVIPEFRNHHALLDAFDMKPGFQYYHGLFIFNSAKETL